MVLLGLARFIFSTFAQLRNEVSRAPMDRRVPKRRNNSKISRHGRVVIEDAVIASLPFFRLRQTLKSLISFGILIIQSLGSSYPPLSLKRIPFSSVSS